MTAKNAFYAQSGGVTAVINASACGVIETARQHPDKIANVYAGRNGIIGALPEELIDTGKESAANIAALRHTPSGGFGSCRYTLKSLEANTSLLYLPIIGMYHGLHEWTAAMTGGIVDARVIAIVDTALESPLGQIAMVPMLAWIANSAPDNLKATFFAVMASFTNLALSASQLGTKYLNEIFLVTREVKDPASGEITVPADYGELGILMTASLLIGLLLPLAAVALVKMTRLRSS